MSLNGSPTELTTAATDAVIAVACLAGGLQIARLRVVAIWKRALWGWVLALLGVASALGAIAHGVAWSASTRATLFGPLYLLLGLCVMLFLVGGIHDWRGEAAARRVLPWALGIGVGFFGLVERLGGAFVIFVVFETAAMVAALAIYAFLWATRRLAGAGLVAAGIGLTIVAGAVQASHLSVRLIVPFDHNGLFHLVQLVATIMLATGLRRGLATTASSTPRAAASPSRTPAR